MHYRKKIYDKYVSIHGDSSEFPDEGAMKKWGRAYDYFLAGLLPEDKDAAILDVACGSGSLLYFFKSRNFRHVKGVDISPEQVALAKTISDEVVEMDALEYLKPHRDKFDLIIGIDILEHLTKEELLDFLAACRAALRDAGRVVFQTPNPAAPMGGSVVFGDLTHEIALTPSCLERLLRLAGFEHYQARECGPVPYGLKSRIRFCSWQIIRGAMRLYDLVEVGGNEYPIYTRVFLATAVKK